MAQEVLKPVKTSPAMRRKLREIAANGGRMSAVSKTARHNIHPTIQALKVRGLVDIETTDTGRPFRFAVFTEQGRLFAALGRES